MKNKKRLILDAALDVIAEHGFMSSPVPLIAKRAGVATGTPYSYFKSKEDLIKALNDEVKAQLAEYVSNSSALQLHTTEEKIKGIVASLLSFFLADRNRFFFFIHFHNSPLGAEFRKTRNQEPSGFGRLLSSIIQQGIDEGSVADIPIDNHFKFCIDVLFPLVRDHYLAVQLFDQQQLDQIPEMCWKAIKK